jgi:hypothetical protein
MAIYFLSGDGLLTGLVTAAIVTGAIVASASLDTSEPENAEMF